MKTKTNHNSLLIISLHAPWRARRTNHRPSCLSASGSDVVGGLAAFTSVNIVLSHSLSVSQYNTQTHTHTQIGRYNRIPNSSNKAAFTTVLQTNLKKKNVYITDNSRIKLQSLHFSEPELESLLTAMQIHCRGLRELNC